VGGVRQGLLTTKGRTMIEFEFSKETVQKFLSALQNSRSIEPPADGWSTDAMIALAGACTTLAECFSKKVNVSEQIERLEADEEQARNDVAAAIDHCVSLTGRIIDGTYNGIFQRGCLIRVQVDGDGEPIIKHVP
jgi:hypothetical protein